MLMDRAAIARSIPHGDGMCMLDGLLSWDESQICCRSESHRRAENPLLWHGRLHSSCLVEFCAQAAALHRALVQQGDGSAGLAFLGAVKQLELPVEYVDPAIDSLQIEARCAVNNPAGAIYQVEARAPQQMLLRGRIVLVLA